MGIAASVYAAYSLHVPLVGLYMRGETGAHLDAAEQTHTEALIFTALLVMLCSAAHLCHDKPVRRFLGARLHPDGATRNGRLRPHRRCRERYFQ